MFAQPGSLDISFDSDGFATADFGSSNDYAQSVVVQPDGKIVTTGWGCPSGASGCDFATLRFNTDGTPDSTFGINGRVMTDIGGATDQASTVVLQADGKILAAGYSYNQAVSESQVSIIRLLTDGSPDTTFSGDGKLMQDAGPLNGSSLDMLVQSDGKIVISGNTYAFPDYYFLVIRLLPDGTADSTFDGDGIATTSFPGNNSRAYGIIQTPDGKLVAAGYGVNGDSYFALAKYQVNGSPDSTFGVNGKVIIDPSPGSDWLYEIANYDTDQIIVCGYSEFSGQRDFMVMRLNADGSPDSTFDNDGWVTTAFPGGESAAHSLVIQPDNKIVAAGFSLQGSSDGFALARYNADGSPDNSFDSDGLAETNINSGDDVIRTVTLQGDGKIVVSGESAAGSDNDATVARYYSGLVVERETPASAGNEIRIYPNPVTEETAIRFTLEKASVLSWTAGSADGRLQLIPFSTRLWKAGTHEVKLQLPAAWPSGIYWLTCTDGFHSLSSKVIK